MAHTCEVCSTWLGRGLACFGRGLACFGSSVAEQYNVASNFRHVSSQVQQTKHVNVSASTQFSSYNLRAVQVPKEAQADGGAGFEAMGLANLAGSCVPAWPQPPHRSP